MPRQSDRHFAEDIFKCIFLYKNGGIFIQISMKYASLGLYELNKCDVFDTYIDTEYIKNIHTHTQFHIHPFSIQAQILVVVDSHFCALNDKLLICATQKDRTTWNICTGKYSPLRNI